MSNFTVTGRDWLRSSLLTLGLTFMVAAEAAKPVPPPSLQLRTDENQVAVVTVLAKPDSTHLSLRAEQVLHGPAFTDVSVLIDAKTAGTLTLGGRYVVAFSAMMKDPITRGKGWVKNPDGLEVVGFTEVERAVFPVSDGLLSLLTLPVTAETNSARIDAALALAATPDARSRYFASLELLIDRSLTAAMTPVQCERLKALLAADGYVPEHRDLLYRAALQLPAELQTGWLADQARKDLQALGSQYDLASRIPSLAKSATTALAKQAVAADQPLLTGLLRSNAPGVAKAALQALHGVGVNQANEAVVAALAETTLPAESRRVFEQYRKTGKLPG